jgi:hypothetical protein
VPEFDSPTVFKLGWLEKAKGKVHTTQSDERFQD